MEKIVLLIQMLLCTIVGFTQITQTNTTSPSSPESITLVTYGDGKNKDEAINVALRSAIEQTFGTFVSANTSILNDELIKDEIVSISSGNIEDYKELDYQVLPDGRSTVTLQATVSINKLVSYAQAKGSSCELNTSAFIAQLNYKKLQKESIKKAWEHYAQMKIEKARDYVTLVNITNIEMEEANSGLGVFVIVHYNYVTSDCTPSKEEFLDRIGIGSADEVVRGVELTSSTPHVDWWDGSARYNIVCNDNLGWTERVALATDRLEAFHMLEIEKIIQHYPDMRFSSRGSAKKLGDNALGGSVYEGTYIRYYPMQDYEKLTNIQMGINNNVNDYLKELKEFYDRQINRMIVLNKYFPISMHYHYNPIASLLGYGKETDKLYNYGFTQYVQKCKNIDGYCKAFNSSETSFYIEAYDLHYLSDENKKIFSDEAKRCGYHY